MKAITLTQPWASAVAVGIKCVETRSWSTNYRGPIAIHAAKTMPGYAKDFARAMLREGRRLPNPLPIGQVIATANLVRVEPTKDAAALLSRTELLFGDYTDGRYAWFLEDVKPLPEAIPAKGALGLWTWEAPDA